MLLCLYMCLNQLCHCGGTAGWDTAVQAGRSRVRFPIVSLEFFIDIILLNLLETFEPICTAGNFTYIYIYIYTHTHTHTLCIVLPRNATRSRTAVQLIAVEAVNLLLFVQLFLIWRLPFELPEHSTHGTAGIFRHLFDNFWKKYFSNTC